MGFSSLPNWVTFATYKFKRDEVNIVDGMAGLVEMDRCWCGVVKFMVVENRSAVLSEAFVELAFGLSNVLMVAFFAID